MITVHDKSLCSGCGACFNICPENCIKMCEDSEGFLYPEADKSKCIDCGLCEKACPIFKEYKGNPEGRAYACINKDESVRMESSSGGIFRLIAEYVLAKGGVVFGAAFDEDLTVHHILAESPGEIYKLQGSKYVQSRIENTYKKAKEYLENGRMVLFTGTPCQISGIKAYLNKDYENLILQDIVCHGVPSGKVWKKYVNFREAVSA